MDQAREKLTQASHKLAEAMYKAHSRTPVRRRPERGCGRGSPAATAEPKKDEGVIDAEYVDVDDKKVS